MNSTDNSTKQGLWYALRVTYNRELKVKAELDSLGIRNFVPMQYKRVELKGVLVKKLVPIIHNLIFVFMDEGSMKEYKATTTMPVRYIMNRETRRPLTVPQRQMDSFMAIAGTYDENIVYLNPKPGDFAVGDRVRVMGGIFEGAEGVLTRVKGDRRVVVNIEGVVAVASAFIHPSFLEKIDK